MCSENSNFHQIPIASSDYQTLLYCATITANDLTAKKVDATNLTPQQLFHQSVNIDFSKTDNNTIPCNTSINTLVKTNYDNYITSITSTNTNENLYNNNTPLQAISGLSNLSPNFAYSQNYMIPYSHSYQSNHYHESFLQSSAFNYYWPPSTDIYDGLSRFSASVIPTEIPISLSNSIASTESVTAALSHSISNTEIFQEQKKNLSTSVSYWNTTPISISNLSENSIKSFNDHTSLSTSLMEDNYLTYKVKYNFLQNKLKS